MAIYHLSMKPVRRGQGRSSTAAAAYRAADRIRDYTTDQLFDYTRRRGVEHTEIVLPSAGVPRDIPWARNRTQLWNAAEAAERRKDARVGREWEIALPAELDRERRVDLALKFAHELANRYGCAVDVAVHKPHRRGDQRNHHAHLLATTRTIEAEGLGRKTDIELGDRDRGKKGLGGGADELTTMRQRWAAFANEHLRTAGHLATIDHRSLREQGIDREATVHLGAAISGLERRGIASVVGERIRAERAAEAKRKLERAAELKALELEEAALRGEAAPLFADLAVALRVRDQSKEREIGTPHEPGSGRDESRKSLQELQEEAARDWLEYRERQQRGLNQPGSEQERSNDVAPSRGKDRVRDGPDDDFSL